MNEAADGTGKDKSIETLRGIAIVLMVAGHVIGSDSTAGLRVADDSAYRYCYESLRLLRMPLFTAISGYVYALRPLHAPSGYGRFLAGKVRRLLIPLVTVSTLQFLAHGLAPRGGMHTDWADMWRIYFFGYDHLWFLQSIFVVIALVGCLDALGFMSRPPRWAAALLGISLLAQVLPNVAFFSLRGATYLCPFFVLGVGLCRFRELLNRPLLLWLCWAVLIHGVARQQWAWFSSDAPSLGRTGLIGISTSLSGMVLLFAYRKANQVLAKLGSYAYTIYLFHVLGTAPARMIAKKVLGKIQLDASLLIFTISLLAGLLLPILADQILRKNALTSLLFLGLKPPRSASNPSAGERMRDPG